MDEFAETQAGFVLPRPGKFWGEYEVISEIGRGGMGIVYKARQSSPQREVALKIMEKNSSSVHYKRFEREIKITSQLNHPGIARVYNFKKIGSIIVLVMEYIEGESLDQFLQKNILSLREKLDIFIEILEAIKYAHDLNFIHRDIKPGNILVTNKRKVKIIDFGLARQVSHKFDLTKTGDILGTPQYMAPEQISGKRSDIDKQTDIYALGSILYEMMTNTKMIEQGSIINVFYNIQHQKIDSPKDKNSEVTKDLEKIWHKSIIIKKKERYQDIEYLLQDLRLFLSGKKIESRFNIKEYAFLAIFVIIVVLAFVSMLFFYTPKSGKLSIENSTTSIEKEILLAMEQGNDEKVLEFYEQNESLKYNTLLAEGIARSCYNVRQKGISAFWENDLVLAESYLQQVVQVFSHDVESLSYLAKIRCFEVANETDIEALMRFNEKDGQAKEKLEKAIAYLEKCIKIDPYTSEYFLLLGKIKFSLKNYSDSVNHLIEVLYLEKNDIEALELLYRVPYFAPDLQQECYPYAISAMVTANQENNNIDLYENTFIEMEKMYAKDYFQYVSAIEINEKKDSTFVIFCKEIFEKSWDKNLENRLLSFKYNSSFDAKVKDIQEKYSPNSKEHTFLQNILQIAKKQKEQEYSKFCYYQLAYMYNHKNWKRTKQLEEHFQDKLQEIISANEEERKNVLITFLAVKAYIKSYGFTYLLELLRQEKTCTINKIILSVILRTSFIPVNTEIFSEWQGQNYQQEESGFIAYIIGQSLYTYDDDHEKDTYYRKTSEKYPILTENEEKILAALVESDDIRVKTSALMSIYKMINPFSAAAKEKNKKIIQQVRSLLASPSDDIRLYIHACFWQENSNITNNQNEYLEIYNESIRKETDWRIKKFLIFASRSINRIVDTKQYLKNVIEDSTVSKTKEKRILSMYAISTLALFENVGYREMKEYLNSVDCSVFERMYGLIVKLQKIISANFTAEMAQTVIEFWQDVGKQQEPHFKSFSIDFFSRIGFKQDINDIIKEDPLIFQGILYSMYRDINMYLDEGKNGRRLLREYSLLKLLIPQKTVLERKNIAKKYWEEETEDMDIRIAALCSYIPLEIDEAKKDKIFEEMHQKGTSKQKKITAIAFTRSVEWEVKKDHEVDFGYITENTPEELYSDYIVAYTQHLKQMREKGSDRLKLWEKWYDYAIQLDPKKSRYLFEKSLLLYHSNKNEKEKVREALDKAIFLEKDKQSTENYLYYYYKARLLGDHSPEAIQEVEQSLELTSHYFARRKIVQLYFDWRMYKKAIHVYEKIITEKPFRHIENYFSLIECLLQIGNKQTALYIIDITWEMYKRRFQNEEKSIKNKKQDFMDEIRKNAEAYKLLQILANEWQKK